MKLLFGSCHWVYNFKFLTLKKYIIGKTVWFIQLTLTLHVYSIKMLLQVTISDYFRFEAKLCRKFIDQYQITVRVTVNVLSVDLTKKCNFIVSFFALLTSNIIIKFLFLSYTRVEGDYDVKIRCKCPTYFLYNIIQQRNIP